jgi:hypothetical protein
MPTYEFYRHIKLIMYSLFYGACFQTGFIRKPWPARFFLL